ncbi:methyltransferase [Streptomyces sp. NPDC093707]|uniref:methyltransferase n=1 Tax=Streptomyces sp. NPDC093707 TaxID=3154984 RepID=UPI00344C9639
MNSSPGTFGDVESALLSLDAVEAVQVTVEADRRGRSRPVARVVLAPGAAQAPELQESGEGQGTSASDELVQGWQDVYELTYSESALKVADDLNLSGWRDSYTGRPIERRQMEEWIDQTVRMVEGTGPRRLLEIGCGTGLLMFRLAAGTDWYVGLDLSATAVDYLMERRGPLADRVRLLQAPADEIGRADFPDRCATLLEGMPGPHRPDCVLINSVTQCFPSADYLIDVLDAAVRLLEPGGSLVVGDMRSLATQRAFATSVERVADPEAGHEELARRVEDRVRGDRELVIDPAFFAAWAATQKRPVSISVRPKLGAADNELNRFRYDAVVTVEPSEPGDPGTKWLSWDDVGRSVEGLRSAVRAAVAEGAAVGVTGIPNRLVRPFTSAGPLPEGEETTAAELIEKLDGYPARVLLSPSRREEGELAVVCGPESMSQTLWDQAHEGADPRRFVNDPLTAFVERKAPQMLRRYLAGRLPAASVPSRILVVSELPGTGSEEAAAAHGA